MIEMNIDVLVLVCIACVIIGFIIATFLSNAKINDLYDEIASKNKTINFYKNYVEGIQINLYQQNLMKGIANESN